MAWFSKTSKSERLGATLLQNTIKTNELRNKALETFPAILEEHIVQYLISFRNTMTATTTPINLWRLFATDGGDKPLIAKFPQGIQLPNRGELIKMAVQLVPIFNEKYKIKTTQDESDKTIMWFDWATAEQSVQTSQTSQTVPK